MGVGVGITEATGFQLLGALCARGLPNQPNRLPVIGSVFGSQSFEANTPRVISRMAAAPPRPIQSRFRSSADRVRMNGIRSLLFEMRTTSRRSRLCGFQRTWNLFNVDLGNEVAYYAGC